jgi:cobyrinic acid a,c-diamide synthase
MTSSNKKHVIDLWFVTFVTHNSRVSQRMVEYKVKKRVPVLFDEDDRKCIVSKIEEACKRYHIEVLNFLVLPDHVHLVIKANNVFEITKSVQKIKGYSAYAFRKEKEWLPGERIWAQKFYKKRITSEKALFTIMEYINRNPQKHADQWELDISEFDLVNHFTRDRE